MANSARWSEMDSYPPSRGQRGCFWLVGARGCLPLLVLSALLKDLLQVMSRFSHIAWDGFIANSWQRTMTPPAFCGIEDFSWVSSCRSRRPKSRDQLKAGQGSEATLSTMRWIPAQENVLRDWTSSFHPIRLFQFQVHFPATFPSFSKEWRCSCTSKPPRRY